MRLDPWFYLTDLICLVNEMSSRIDNLETAIHDLIHDDIDAPAHVQTATGAKAG